MDAKAAAADLYGLAPEEFTAARNGRSRAAKQAGDPALAAQISAMRKPTLAAWVANMLVRRHAGPVERFLALGEAMRGAQGGLAADQMRTLSQQRHQVVNDLLRLARELADSQGKHLGVAGARELEATLDAAFADPGAAEALRSGSLTSAMSYSGLGPVDVTNAVALPERARSPKTRPEPPAPQPNGPAGPSAGTSGRSPGGTRRSPGAPRRRDRPSAAGALRAARAAVARAEKSAGGAGRRLDEARRELARCDQAVADAERAVRSARTSQQQARADVLRLQREHDGVQRQVVAARTAEAQAQAQAQATVADAAESPDSRGPARRRGLT